MASVRKVKRRDFTPHTSYAWEVRYRDPQKRDRSKTFRTRAEAVEFAESVETDINRGQFLDPPLGKKEFGECGWEWLEARKEEIKPKTFMSYEGLLRAHLLPAFEHAQLRNIRPLDIQKFLGKMTNKGLSRSRVRQARQLLSMILNAAVDNGYIGRSAVPRGALKGWEPKRAQHPLTFEEVHAVANAVPNRYRAEVCVGAKLLHCDARAATSCVIGSR
jgi:integrase